KKILINKDTIEIGNYYSFYTLKKEAFLGKVVAANKNSLLIYFDGEIKTINKADIVMIEEPRKILFDLSVTRKKISEERVYWMFSTGLILTKPNSSTYSGAYSNGLNISAQSYVTFNNSFGLRADLDYFHIPKEDYQISYNYSERSTYSYTGGSINGMLTKFNITFGYFDPVDLINAYFVAGIGTGGFFKTRKTTTYYQTFNNSTSIISSSTDPSKLYFTIGVSAGIGLSVKLNKYIRAFSEYQFNKWANDIGGFNCLNVGVMIRGK
ncbi:MAG: hypothetical protein WC358_12055, partial [Ignavibacteria bacterium]